MFPPYSGSVISSSASSMPRLRGRGLAGTGESEFGVGRDKEISAKSRNLGQFPSVAAMWLNMGDCERK